MKCIGLVLVPLLLVGGIAATKHKSATLPSKPLLVIVSQDVVHPENCPDDPLASPCTFVRIVVENRSFKPISATISCGVEEDEAKVTVSPRTRLTIDAELTVYIPDPSCEIR